MIVVVGFIGSGAASEFTSALTSDVPAAALSLTFNVNLATSPFISVAAVNAATPVLSAALKSFNIAPVTSISPLVSSNTASSTTTTTPTDLALSRPEIATTTSTVSPASTLDLAGVRVAAGAALTINIELQATAKQIMSEIIFLFIILFSPFYFLDF